MLILSMDEDVDVYYLWQRRGGGGGRGWGEETMPLGRRMLEQERMPSTLKALQAVFNLYYRSIPCSIQYLLHAIERQNIAPVQLGGCTVYTMNMQCNQVNIKCITNQPFRPQQYN